MMRALFKILIPVLALAGPAAHAAGTCESLFFAPIQPVRMASDSSRVEITKVTDAPVRSRLVVEEGAFPRDTNQAAIELMRMLVRNNDFKLEDKNVLLKNKFTVGIPLREGYTLQLTYESRSNANPRFVLQDRLVLVTPAGREVRVTEELMSRDQLSLARNEYELADYAELGQQLRLRVPLVVEGPLLSKVARLADYFEYFTKEELGRIVRSSSMLRIETLFQIRRARHVFFKVLIKEPFKFMIGGALAFAVFNSQMIVPQHREVPTAAPAEISATYVANTLNNIAVPAGQPALRQEFRTLQAEVAQKIARHSFSEISAFDVRIDPENVFSREHNVFVFSRVNENTGSTHTYLVFAKDISQNRNLAIQYYVVEISAARYANLIAYINGQGAVPPAAAAPAGPR